MKPRPLIATGAPAPLRTLEGQPRTSAALNVTLRIALILAAAPARSQLVPIPLDYQRAGEQVVLSWTNATFSLQTAPGVQGTFTNVPGATSPHTNALSGGQAYFRLLGVDTPAGMVLIPAGSFMMGATTNMGHEYEANEVRQHSVYVSAFYMDRRRTGMDYMTWRGMCGSGVGIGLRAPTMARRLGVTRLAPVLVPLV